MVKKGLFRRSRDASPSNRRRGRGERGASMVEFALIAPVFFAVVFGGIEIGLMFRSYLALEDLSRSSARVASIQRDSPDADEAILTRISDRAAALQGDITQIVIFQAPTLDSEVPAGCLTGSQSGPDFCQTYSFAEFEALVNGTGSPQNGWDGPDRRAGDNIGIYVEYSYQFATGFFQELTLSTTSIEVIESDL